MANGKYTAQDATTAQKGIVQLSSATNSTSESQAATPKPLRPRMTWLTGNTPHRTLRQHKRNCPAQ
ncbi:phage tail protein [Escherichia coli]|nr:phage tail protein [Escherichia coli]